MDEEDVTLYVNCRNQYSLDAMYAFIECLLIVLKKKYKADERFKIIEIQLEEDYIFYARFIDLERYNPKFVNEKYFISDQEIVDFIKVAGDDEKVFKFIFGDFIKGLRN